MQAVLDAAHNLCPPIVQKSGARDQLVNAMSERIHLQEHLNLSAILEQMVTDVFSKLKYGCCAFGWHTGDGDWRNCNNVMLHPWIRFGVWPRGDVPAGASWWEGCGLHLALLHGVLWHP